MRLGYDEEALKAAPSNFLTLMPGRLALKRCDLSWMETKDSVCRAALQAGIPSHTSAFVRRWS